MPISTSPRHRRRSRPGATFALAATTTLAMVAIGTGPVRAGADGGGSVDDDAIEARVRYDGDSSDTPGCSWAPVTGVDPVSGSTREMPIIRRVGRVTETLYERSCATTHSLHWVRDDVPVRMARHAQQRASRLIPSLLTHTAPPADNLVVNVGTWFWVPSALWKPVSVTVTIPTLAGPIIVTTTATPTTLRFSPGNGSPSTSCRGPGRPWHRSFGDSSVSSCMYTYRAASHTRASGVFNARFTVEWTVTWTSNLGVGGRLPDVRIGVGTTVRVLELQALTR